MTDNNNFVPDEILLNDIELTKKEADSYNMISVGFNNLARLPENIGTTEEKLYMADSRKYDELEQQCRAFLRKLIGLAEKRGLAV